jgi:UDP-glucose 4-epimerase
MRVLITGVSGYIGGRLAGRLVEMDSVEIVAGVDLRPRTGLGPKFVFEKKDVRESLTDLMRQHRIDTLVHAAYVLPPIHDQGLMEDINLNGTRRALLSAVEAGVGHVLYTSSATAYGFHPDNENPLTEESPLRGNDDFTYSRTKRILEGEFAAFGRDHPEIRLTVVRPCFVVGPGFNNPLTDHLRKKVVPLPSERAPFQLVHEDDLIEVLVRLLEWGRGGVFNVAADGLIDLAEMARMLGHTPVSLPFGLLYLLNQAAWGLRLSFVTKFPSPGLNLLRYSWAASNRKLKDTLGYEFRYDTRAAFADFVRVEKERGR